MLGIARVITDIRNNQRVRMVTPIDRSKRAGAHTSNNVQRQLFGLANSKQPLPIRAIAPDDSGRTISAAPDIMGND